MGWIRRFILFNGKRHPDEMGESEITAFLSHLATHGQVSASTQNQALAAILFLYRQVLGRELDWLAGIVHAKRPERLPVVLSRDEAAAVLARMQGVPALMASLLYGSGLRVLECAPLRVASSHVGDPTGPTRGPSSAAQPDVEPDGRLHARRLTP